jgi:hypothetical protein
MPALGELLAVLFDIGRGLHPLLADRDLQIIGTDGDPSQRRVT